VRTTLEYTRDLNESKNYEFGVSLMLAF